MTEESSRNNEMCWVPRFPKQCVSAHSCGEIWATGTASAHASAGEFVEGVPHTIIATVRARGSEHDGRHGDSAAEQGETPPRIVLRFIAQRNYPRSTVFSDVFSTRFPASKVPPPRDSRGNEHANGKEDTGCDERDPARSRFRARLGFSGFRGCVEICRKLVRGSHADESARRGCRGRPGGGRARWPRRRRFDRLAQIQRLRPIRPHRRSSRRFPRTSRRRSRNTSPACTRTETTRWDTFTSPPRTFRSRGLTWRAEEPGARDRA